MNGYERLIKVMRSQKGKSESVFKVGTITQNLGCKTGDLELFREDLLFSQELLTGYLKGEKDFVSPVKKGDKVLIARLGEDFFVVISKLC